MEDADLDFEEKGVRLVPTCHLSHSCHAHYTMSIRVLHTYAVTCGEPLSTSEKTQLKTWLEQEEKKEGGSQLADRWSLTIDELRALISKAA